MRLATFIAVAALAIAGASESAAGQKAFPQPKKFRSAQHRVNYLKRAVRYHKYIANNGKGHNKRWHAKAVKWTVRELQEARAKLLPKHYQEWLCIYGYENGGYGWTANTGNGYYGGLQMDMEFQRDYGKHLLKRKGTANNWTPLEQMRVAEKAYRSGRGFYPWPNTARYCGLI
jgi:hypothetical protein